jgi:hypothetical protein
MRWIALLSLICLIGGATAQQMFTGEGYTSTQLSFMDSPVSDTGTFEPFVTNYWSSYIQNSQNATTAPVDNPKNTMTIWYNTFPMKFDQPVTLSKTSFEGSVAGGENYTPTQMNSMLLERSTLQQFDQNPGSKYGSVTPTLLPSSSFSVASADNKSVTESSSGQVLSQGIISLFTT